VVLIVAVAIAVRAIDVNDFIAPIQQRVKDATGRDLVIRGGIDFKLSLEPELWIDDVSLSNAEWGKSAQMLTAKRVEAQVKLLPLLQRRFEIVRFKLIDPVIALETDAGGKGNWEFSSAGGGAATSPASGFNAFTNRARPPLLPSIRCRFMHAMQSLRLARAFAARSATSPSRWKATWGRCRRWPSDAGRTPSASKAKLTASRHRSRPKCGSRTTRSISTSFRSAPTTAPSRASLR
ncbi:MAG: AsmA family protein, partial [Betaproteobacteria bacterium]